MGGLVGGYFPPPAHVLFCSSSSPHGLLSDNPSCYTAIPIGQQRDEFPPWWVHPLFPGGNSSVVIHTAVPSHLCRPSLLDFHLAHQQTCYFTTLLSTSSAQRSGLLSWDHHPSWSLDSPPAVLRHEMEVQDRSSSLPFFPSLLTASTSSFLPTCP